MLNDARTTAEMPSPRIHRPARSGTPPMGMSPTSTQGRNALTIKTTPAATAM
jgi:hypothetical protein